MALLFVPWKSLFVIATFLQPNNARTSGQAKESSEQNVHWVHEVMLLLDETEV
jgi:hypothetical protein